MQISADEAAIQGILEKRGRAIAAKNAEASVQAYAPEIVVYDIAPPLSQRGNAATNPDAARQWFATWDGPIGYEFRSPVIRVAEELAFGYGLVHLHGKRTGGELSDIWMRVTFCLEKRDGIWMIVHEHTSVPMMMDGSGIAAANLKP